MGGEKRRKNRGNEGGPASFSVVSFLAAATGFKGRIRLPPTRLNRRHSRLRSKIISDVASPWFVLSTRSTGIRDFYVRTFFVLPS